MPVNSPPSPPSAQHTPAAELDATDAVTGSDRGILYPLNTKKVQPAPRETKDTQKSQRSLSPIITTFPTDTKQMAPFNPFGKSNKALQKNGDTKHHWTYSA